MNYERAKDMAEGFYEKVQSSNKKIAIEAIADVLFEMEFINGGEK